LLFLFFFFFSSRRRHTRFSRDWSSDVCSSDLCSVERSVSRKARSYEVFFFKDIAIEIKGVAMFRYFRRPTPTALRGLLPCLAHRSVEFVGRALRCQNRRQPKRLPYNSVFFTHYT